MHSLFRNSFIEGSKSPGWGWIIIDICCTHHVSIYKNEFESVNSGYHVRNNEL